MYKIYEDKDDYISLHDCHAEKAALSEDTLSFYFPEGFWILSEHESNNLNQTVRTDASEVMFRLMNGEESDVTVYVFTDAKNGKTMREEWELGKFIHAINSGVFRLEFLYQYKGYNAQIYDCWIWFDQKPYHKECELRISTNKVTYCWNNLCADKLW